MSAPIINGGEDRVWKWSKMIEFPTFMGSWPRPWIQAWSLPFFISYWVIPVYQISSKSKRFFVDGQTHGRANGNLPLIVLGRLPKFGSRPKKGHVTWTRPFQGPFVICRLWLAMFNPHIKFEISTITCNEEMKDNAKCKNSRFEPPFGGFSQLVSWRIYINVT